MSISVLSTPPNPILDVLPRKMPTSVPCERWCPSLDQLPHLVLTSACSLKPNNQLDFNDPVAVKQLTKTLLQVDFGLKIDLPDNRLCPPVSLI